MQEKTKEQNASLPKVWFFLLINTKSGGGWGKCYLQLKKQQFSFQYQKRLLIFVKLIDLFNQQKKTLEMANAKQLQTDSNNDVRVIICGGDGTIAWGIEECIKANLNFQKLQIACLPIGTGNDFSRTIGWGSHPLEFQQDNIFPLKKRVVEWINSSVSKYDVWQVEISVFEKGGIYKVKDKQDFLTDKKVYSSGFVNYVGVGIDARVSYNFQKNRKSTKLMNVAVYGYFACLLCCRPIPELSEALETFEQNEVEQQLPSESTKVMQQQNLQDPMIEHFNESDSNRSSRKINFKKGYHGLVCINSISYMAGALNAWDTKNVGCLQNSIKFQKQRVNDGKVEFLGYKNELKLGLERIIHSGARIAQGQGPFVIRFKQESLEYENYVQIDGEGLMIKGIKEVVIKRNPKVPSISVMINNMDNKKKQYFI